MLDFLRSVGSLKSLRRQGWVDRRVPDPESVADHSYRVAMMAWLLGRIAGLDTDRLVKLVLVHDLPEVEAGDATPYGEMLGQGADIDRVVAHWRDIVSAEERAAARGRKHQAEADGLARMTDTLSEELSREVVDLWEEYVAGATPEARFVAEVDKLEALLQAVEYREAGHAADVENFLLSAREVVRHPVLQSLLGEIEAASGG